MNTRRWKPWVIVLAGAGVILLGARAALPLLIEHRLTERLQAMDGYIAEIRDVDVELWRGAYEIEGFTIRKQNMSGVEPFLATKRLDVSVDWSVLWSDHRAVGEITFYELEANLIKAQEDGQSQTGDDFPWKSKLGELFFLPLNNIAVRNGRVRFRAPAIDVKDALIAEDLNGEIQNLSNTAGSDKEAYAYFNVHAVLLNAPLHVEGRMDPKASEPLFDLNLTLKQVDLPAVNPWLREYLKADAQSGTFELYLELAADGKQLNGYAKPVMQNLNVFNLGEDADGLLQSIWEAGVDLVMELVENQQEGQVAYRIPINGTVEDPKMGTVTGMLSALSNAFVRAFSLSLEHSVSLPDDKA